MNNEIKYKEYLIFNNFNAIKINSDYLIISHDGSFIFLSLNEYNLLVNETIDADLSNILENKCFIITERNKNKIIDNYKREFNHIFRHVSSHQIIVNDDKNSIDIEQAKKIIDFMLQSPSYYISIEFVGNEPLRNFSVIRYIVNQLRLTNENKKLKFIIYTGLNFFDSTVLDFLIKENFSIKVRLDGPSELHNGNSFYKECWNNYTDVIKKIKLLKSKLLELEAYPIITKKSLLDYKRILDEYLKLDFKKIELKPLLFLNYNDKETRDKFFTVEEFFDFYKNCIQYIVHNNIDIIEISMLNALLTLFQKENKGLFDLVAPTKETINNLAYDLDGSIYPSYDAFKVNKELFQLGNIMQSYEEVMNSKQFNSFLTSSINIMHLYNWNVFHPYFGLSPVPSYANHNSVIPIIPLDFWYRLANKVYFFIFEKLHFDKTYKDKFEQWVNTKK